MPLALSSRYMERTERVIQQERLSKMLTLKDVSEFLGISERTVYRLIKEKRLPAVRVGGQWRFDSQLLKEWLSGGM